MKLVFLCHTTFSQHSYAGNLYSSLLSYFSGRGFSVRKHSFSEAKKQTTLADHSVLVIEEFAGLLSFLQEIQLRNFIKKHEIDWLIQFSEKKLFSADVQHLVVFSGEKPELKAEKLANTFIAVSSVAAKESFIQKHELPDEKFLKIPFCVPKEFQPVSWSDKQALKMEYAQGTEYFLSHAKHHSQESFLLLLKAFSGFKKWQHSNMKLLLTGSLSFTKNSEWQEKFSTYKYRNDVVFLPVLPSETYAKLLAGAYVFLHTPKKDDDVYGLLEAIRCETASVSFSSDIITEYAGEAALLIEKNNYDHLSEKMILLYKDENLRSRIINQCAQQSANISTQTVYNMFDKLFFSKAEGQ